ncbi:putative YDJ1-mitochondrial and ER import protein [Abortiporus biennis]|nr:putative YDJ1-mitochondrial and ER import protein [Abortiporus biennis]
MVKETKFYDLLDVSPDASESDLKMAYRRKALRTRPDRGGDPELFKEVKHAYEILSDPEKRSVYDAKGVAGLNEPSTGGMDPQDLFSQLLGGGLFGDGDLYKGKTSKLTLTRSVICFKCDGNGGAKTCTNCSGRGGIIEVHQTGPILQQSQHACKECSGTGEIISEKDKCKTCNGKKVVSEKKILELHIDKGMKGGQQITFRGESDRAPGFDPGDVIITIEEKPHERLKRKRIDLFVDQEIDLLTALGGGQFSIKHLDDRALIVNVSPGEVIKNGDVKVIDGQGMPSQRYQEPAALFINFKVIFPDHVDRKTIPYLEKALPPRKPVEKFAKNILLEEVEMSEADSPQHERAENFDQMELEDEAEPRVERTQQ